MQMQKINIGLGARSASRPVQLSVQKLSVQSPRNVTVRFQEDNKSSTKTEVKSDLSVKAPSAPQTDGVDTGAQAKAPIVVANFSRRRELFAGRLAMVGIFATGFWEVVFPNRPNIFMQVQGLAGAVGLTVTPTQVAIAFAILIASNAIGAINPFSPTWSEANLEDSAKRGDNPGTATNTSDFRSLLGATTWGFTKPNELLHGRLAMIGFTGVLVQQLRLGGLTGPGLLAQYAETFGAVPFGVRPDDAFYASVPGYFLAFSALAIAAAYANGKGGDLEDKNIV